MPDKECAGGAIEHVEVPVAIGVQQQLPRLSAPHPIDEHHVLGRIPVVPVVRRELVVPLALAGVGIERDDGIGEEVVAISAHGAIGHRRRIADRPVERVELGIVGARQPRSAAAGLPAVAFPRVVAELSRAGNRVEPPQPLAGHIVGVQESAQGVFAAGVPDDDLVLHDERRARDVEAFHRVRDLDLPDGQTGPRVEADERGVVGADEQPMPEDRDAAVHHVGLPGIADLLLTRVSPDLPPGPRVHRGDRSRVAAARRIHHAVDDERRALAGAVAGHRRRPRGSKPGHVRRIDVPSARSSACPGNRPSTSASCEARLPPRGGARRSHRREPAARTRSCSGPAPAACADTPPGSRSRRPISGSRSPAGAATCCRSRRMTAAACRTSAAVQPASIICSENVSSLRRTPRISRPSSVFTITVAGVAPPRPPPRPPARRGPVRIDDLLLQHLRRQSSGVRQVRPDDPAAGVHFVTARARGTAEEQRFSSGGIAPRLRSGQAGRRARGDRSRAAD